MQVAANWVWVYLMVAVCIHDIPPSPTLPPAHHTVHIYIEYGEAHTEGVRVHQYRLRISRYREGCDTVRDVRVQLSTHLRARVAYTVDTSTSLYR